VVLTVAHLDHQPENCADPENMKALCQRCHNRYDAPMRRRGIKARARDALRVPDMFE
jgi:5-methylcytosine-specific restriction endonuclease McrA